MIVGEGSDDDVGEEKENKVQIVEDEVFEWSTFNKIKYFDERGFERLRISSYWRKRQLLILGLTKLLLSVLGLDNRNK